MNTAADREPDHRQPHRGAPLAPEPAVQAEADHQQPDEAVAERHQQAGDVELPQLGDLAEQHERQREDHHADAHQLARPEPVHQPAVQRPEERVGLLERAAGSGGRGAPAEIAVERADVGGQPLHGEAGEDLGDEPDGDDDPAVEHVRRAQRDHARPTNSVVRCRHQAVRTSYHPTTLSGYWTATLAGLAGLEPHGGVEAIDVHFHIVPQRFVDLMRGQALREIVDVEQAADVDRLQFRPPRASTSSPTRRSAPTSTSRG